MKKGFKAWENEIARRKEEKKKEAYQLSGVPTNAVNDKEELIIESSATVLLIYRGAAREVFHIELFFPFSCKWKLWYYLNGWEGSDLTWVQNINLSFLVSWKMGKLTGTSWSWKLCPASHAPLDALTQPFWKVTRFWHLDPTTSNICVQLFDCRWHAFWHFVEFFILKQAIFYSKLRREERDLL